MSRQRFCSGHGPWLPEKGEGPHLSYAQGMLYDLQLDPLSQGTEMDKCPGYSTSFWKLNLSVTDKFVPILPLSCATISTVGENFLNCQCSKRAGFLPSQPFPFPSIVLTVLENEAAKGKTCNTTQYKLSQIIIQNFFYSTYAMLCRPSGGAILSLVHTLYLPSCVV